MSEQEPIEHPQKTDYQIAEQIRRISTNLIERADTGVARVGTRDMLGNGYNPDDQGSNTPNYLLHNSGGDIHLLKNSGSNSKNEKYIEVVAPFEGRVKGSFVDVENGSKKTIPLTKRQIVSSSAQILGKTRGHVAKKEKAVREFLDT